MPTDYAPPTYDEIRTALSYIPTPSSYTDWYPIAFAIKDALGENGKDLWHDWSRQGDNYNARVAEATWKAAKPKAGGITVATLFKQARDHGYRPDKPAAVLTPEQFAQRALETATKNEIFDASDAVRYQAAANLAHTIWRNSKALTAADLAHPYLQNKGIQDLTAVAGIRINRYQGQNKLVIPVYLRDEQTGKTELVNLQQIDEHGTKRFLYGGQKSGGYAILNGTHADMKDGFYLAEGYATAASVHWATGKPVVIAFDAGNLPVVAARIAERDNLPPETPIYLAADNDRVSQTGLTKATEAAAWLGERAQIRLPEFNAHDITTWQQQHGRFDADGKEQFPSDFNDLMELRGLDAVTTAIHAPLSAERAAQVVAMQPEINERIAHFKDYNIQPSHPFQFETLPLDEAGLHFRANLVLEKFGDERSEKHRHALIAELAKRGIDIRAQVAELSGQQVESVEQPQRQPENEQSGLGQNPNSSTEPRAERAPWGDFPSVIRNGNLGELKNEPEYLAAKGGDVQQAAALVQKLLNEQAVEQIRYMIGDKKPVLVPVSAVEGAGNNKIPLAMAQALSSKLDLPVDVQIKQINKVSRTGTGIDHRLAFQPVFDGRVQADREYLIVDDTLSVGSTVASLRGYIENRGGRVMGAAVMTAHEGALNIAVKPAMIDKIRQKHGDSMDNYWKKEFGYGIEQLTQGEAGHLRAAPNVEQIRDRIVAARYGTKSDLATTELSSSHNEPIRQTSERASDDATLNPIPNPPAADALNASAVGVLAKENPMAQSPTPEDIQRHAQNVAQIADAAEREAMMSEMAEQGIYVRGAVNKILAERAAEMPQQPENEHGEFPQSQSGQPENAAPPTFADELSALNLPADFSFKYQVLPNGREIARIHLAGYGGEIMVDKIEADKGGGYVAVSENILGGKPIHLDNLSTLMREMTFQMRQAAEREHKLHQEPTAAQPQRQPETAQPPEPSQPTAADNAAVAVSEPSETQVVGQPENTQGEPLPSSNQQDTNMTPSEAPASEAQTVENSIEFGGITQEQNPEPTEAQPQLETISAAEVQENLRRAKEKERIEAAQQFTQEAAVGAAIGVAADAALDAVIPGSSMAKTAASVAAGFAGDAAAERVLQQNPMQKPERDAENTEKQPEISKPQPILDHHYSVPSNIQSRYIQTNSGLLGHLNYSDINSHNTVVFQDKGNKLSTPKNDAQTISDMLDVAQAKNWGSIKISGSAEFKRQMWLEANLRGIATSGYKPSKEDLALLANQRENRSRNSIEHQPLAPEPNKPAQEAPSKELGARLVAHGKDHYNHNPDKGMSYFVLLEKDGKQWERWGMDLERAMKESGAQVGDKVELTDKGKDGKRNSFEIQIIERTASPDFTPLRSEADKQVTQAQTTEQKLHATQIQEQVTAGAAKAEQPSAEQRTASETVSPDKTNGLMNDYHKKLNRLSKDDMAMMRKVEVAYLQILEKMPHKTPDEREFMRRSVYQTLSNMIQGNRINLPRLEPSQQQQAQQQTFADKGKQKGKDNGMSMSD